MPDRVPFSEDVSVTELTSYLKRWFTCTVSLRIWFVLHGVLNSSDFTPFVVPHVLKLRVACGINGANFT